jgi:F0F1-type ATP synthase delta subunit
MDSNNLTDLFLQTPTKTEAAIFLNKLSSIADSLYDIKSNLAQKIDQTITINEKQMLLNYCQKAGINIQDPGQFQKLISALKDSLAKIAVVTLTLAIPPTPSLLAHLLEWLQKELKQKLFLEIQVQPEIMGGMIIAQNGRIKEYSLRKLFRAKFGNPKL